MALRSPRLMSDVLLHTGEAAARAGPSRGTSRPRARGTGSRRLRAGADVQDRSGPLATGALSPAPRPRPRALGSVRPSGPPQRLSAPRCGHFFGFSFPARFFVQAPVSLLSSIPTYFFQGIGGIMSVSTSTLAATEEGASPDRYSGPDAELSAATRCRMTARGCRPRFSLRRAPGRLQVLRSWKMRQLTAPPHPLSLLSHRQELGPFGKALR